MKKHNYHPPFAYRVLLPLFPRVLAASLSWSERLFASLCLLKNCRRRGHVVGCGSVDCCTANRSSYIARDPLRSAAASHAGEPTLSSPEEGGDGTTLQGDMTLALNRAPV
jgi:hypothetical protein